MNGAWKWTVFCKFNETFLDFLVGFHCMSILRRYPGYLCCQTIRSSRIVSCLLWWWISYIVSMSKNRLSTVYSPKYCTWHCIAVVTNSLWIIISVWPICIYHRDFSLAQGKLRMLIVSAPMKWPPMEFGTKMKHDTLRSMYAIRKKCMTGNVTICSKQWTSVVPEAGIKGRESNYIPQILWDVITCPCPWYLLLAQH